MFPFKSIFSSVNAFFKKLKPIHILLFIIGCLVLYSLVLSCKVSSLKNKLANSESKIVYYTDSIKVFKSVNDNLIYEKQLIEHSNENLKNKYSDLLASYDELVKSNKNKKPIVITNTEIQFNKINDFTDSTFYNSINSIVKYSKEDSTYTLFYEDPSLTLHSRLLSTGKHRFLVDCFNYKTNLDYAIVEDKEGLLYVQLKSNDPSLSITNINTSIFNLSKSQFIQNEVNKKINSLRKPSRFSLGLQFGYGITYQYSKDTGYKTYTSPYLGLGLSYNFLSF